MLSLTHTLRWHLLLHLALSMISLLSVVSVSVSHRFLRLQLLIDTFPKMSFQLHSSRAPLKLLLCQSTTSAYLRSPPKRSKALPTVASFGR